MDDDGEVGEERLAELRPLSWSREIGALDLAALVGSPRELLSALIDGDPLGLRALAAERRDARAVLLSTHRLFQRAAARIAYEGVPPDLDDADAWIAARVERSIDDLLEEDRSAHRDGAPVEDDEDHRILTTRVGGSPERARSACVAFNDLPPEVRRAWFGLAQLGESVPRLAETEGTSEAEIRGRIARALRVLLAALSHEGEEA